MNVPAKKSSDAATIENVLMRGDLKDLSEAQRTEYYLNVCKSLGLNPTTRPFDYLMLNGKLQLYARRDAADQLRKINGISIEVVSREVDGDLLTVHVRAKDKTGRTDEDFGVVPFKGGATEIAANSIMKAITKAKRRVTLSISGLGFMDESETAFLQEETAQASPSVSDDDLIAEHDAPVENKPYKISFQSWRMFGEILVKELSAAESKSDVFEWLEANKTTLAEMEKKVPVMFANLTEKINEIKDEPS